MEKNVPNDRKVNVILDLIAALDGRILKVEHDNGLLIVYADVSGDLKARIPEENSEFLESCPFYRPSEDDDECEHCMHCCPECGRCLLDQDTEVLMQNTIYRVMGKRGRITIPYEFRQQVGFGYNDILSFTKQDDNTVIVKREKICDNCNHRKVNAAVAEIPEAGMTLMELLDSLTPAQQKAALVHLSVKWAEHLKTTARAG